MDIMNINLTTNLMRKAVSKVIEKVIYKKCGYEVNIQLNELAVTMVDGETKIRTNVELNLSSDEFKRILSEV